MSDMLSKTEANDTFAGNVQIRLQKTHKSRYLNATTSMYECSHMNCSSKMSIITDHNRNNEQQGT